MTEIVGVVIDEGPTDWQIFQQDSRGVAEISVSGRWVCPSEMGGKAKGVDLRLMSVDTGGPAAPHLDWTAVRMRPDGTWSGSLKNVPAGGLYRLETHLRSTDNPAIEWSHRGDVRHFLGVGDLWVIAGQSNSAGYGRGATNDPPELGVHLFNNAMRWTLASHPLNESTDTAHPANREHANSGHSPWLHWARLVRREMGFPVGLIQTSLGGSPFWQWNPTEPGKDGGPVLYKTMLQVVAAAGGKVRGILWYQGESDCGPGAAETYRQRFVSAVRAWRKALKNPALPVCTVQLNRVFCPQEDQVDRDWSLVREAQRQVARRLKGTTVSPSLDLPLNDDIHTASSGNILLGERVAAAALGGVYGRAVSYLAPEPISARRSASARRINIEFANVAGRMETGCQTAVPFRVEDANGAVEVRRVEYPGGRKVRLHLGRRLLGKAVVHGAYGADPPPVPRDMPRVMPMLGFHGLPVQ